MVDRALFVIFLMITAISGCSLSKTETQKIVVTSVDTIGTDHGKAAFCSDFSLNIEDAQTFFQRSKKISVKEMHDRYDYLPCFVQGKCLFNSMLCKWKIRASGTATVNTDTESYLYGCKDCF